MNINHVKQRQTFFFIKASAIACEIPIPSFGEVPRPNSSIKTSESESASPNIIAEDAISLANVLKFFSMSSSFERRVRREQ